MKTRLQRTVDAIAAAAPPGADVAIGVRVLPPPFVRGAFDAPLDAELNADVLHVCASAGKPLWIAAALEQTPPERLAALAEDVFRTSDNVRTGDIIDFVGIDAVNDFLRRAGLRDTALIRWRYGRERRATHASERMGEDNYFTARDAIRFLARLHEGSLFEDRARTDALLGWMTLAPRQGHCGWLGARLPERARATLRHKAGCLPPGTTSDDDRYRTLNELGLLEAGSRTVAVALLTRRGDWDAQQRWMEQSALELFNVLGT